MVHHSYAGQSATMGNHQAMGLFCSLYCVTSVFMGNSREGDSVERTGNNSQGLELWVHFIIQGKKGAHVEFLSFEIDLPGHWQLNHICQVVLRKD